MSAKIRKRGNRWVTTVYIRGHRTWVSGETRAELEDNLARALGERARAKNRSEPVDNFARRWTRDYPRRKDSTNTHNAERIAKLATDFAGVLLCDVTRPQARAWALANRSRWKTARAMFSDAVRDDLADSNPFMGLRLDAVTRGRRDLVAPTETDVQKLAEIAGDVWGDYGTRVYANLILTAAYTGMRPGELYALRWDDIDWQTAAIRVERQYNHRTGVITTPKNGLARIVPLVPVAHRALNTVPRQSDEVFFTAQGARFSGRIQHYYWHPVRCAFGRPDLDFYALRHAFGTMLANRGVAPYDIAQAMGHQDGGKLAMQTYIHVTERDARARIHAAFGSNIIDIRRGAVAGREQAGGSAP